MSTPENDNADAVSTLQAEVLTPEMLERLKKAIDSGAATQLMLAAVATERRTGCTNENAITRVMARLERLAEREGPTAFILMASLWPIANRSLMHDVCDAIDLWLVECRSAEVTKYLTDMISSEPDPDNRSHYERWLHAG